MITEDNLIPDPTPGEAYVAERQEELNTIADSDWNALLSYGLKDTGEQAQVEPTVQQDPDPEAPAPVEEEKGMFEKGMDVVNWAASPLMALGDGAIAPLAHKYESDTVGGQAVVALKVSGSAIMNRLLPQLGQEQPEYAKQATENLLPDASPTVKSLVSGTIDVLGDPTLSMSLPFAKVIQSGMRQAKATEQALGKGKTFKGIFQEGITELLTFGKGIDPAELTELGALAVKADSGNKAAIQALDDKISQSDVMQDAIAMLDDADVTTELKGIHDVIGNPNAPVFKQSFAEEAPELLKKSLESNDQARVTYLNTARINSTEEVDNIINRTTEIYAADFRKAAGSQSNSVTAQKAQNSKLTDLLGKKTTEFAAEEAYAMRQILLSSANQLVVLAKRASLPTASPMDELAFTRAHTLNRAIQEKATGVASAQGRALQAQKIVAKEGRGRLREINKLITELPDNKHERDVLKQYLKDLNAEEASKLVSKFTPGAGVDALTEVYVNSILSGPITHAVNIASNTMNLAISPTESYLSGMNAAVRGDYDQALGDIVEGTAKLSGVVKGVTDAMRLVYHRGDFDKVGLPQALGKKHELAEAAFKPAVTSEALGATGTLGSFIDYAGRFIRLPGKALLAEDKVFKTIHYRVEEAAQAARAAQKGTTSDDKRAIYRAMRNNPTGSMVGKSIDMADYYTFTNDLGKVGTATHKALQSNPVTRILVPFFKTPTNIVKMGMKYGPFGDVYRAAQGKMFLNNAEGDLARAQLAMGTLIPAATVAMMSDRITGRIDKSTPTGRFQSSKGEPEYSIRVGDEWISYEKIEPIRSVLGMIANYSQAMNSDSKIDSRTGLETETAKRLTAAFVAPFVQTVTDNYMLQTFSSITQMLNALSDENPDGFIKTFNRIAASATIPGSAFLKQTNQNMYDETFRKADSYIDMVKQTIPGLSNTLPANHTLWGDEQIYPDGLGPDALSPIRTKSVKEDEVDKELIRLKVRIPGPIENITPGMKGVKVALSPEQIARASVIRGKGVGSQTLKERITLVLDDPSFKSLSDPLKRDQIENVLAQSTDYTKQILYSQDKGLQDKYRANVEAYTRHIGVTQ